MSYSRLFIWVEGQDDIRFFETVLKSKFKEKYDWVEVRPYANMKKEKLNSFIKSIKSMKSDYILVTDLDNSPCVTHKKDEKTRKVSEIDKGNIVVVIKEIESWYAAGLSKTKTQFGKVPKFESTNHLVKEKFISLIPKSFGSRIDFMVEILKNFSVPVAKKKNTSFNYILHKYSI